MQDPIYWAAAVGAALCVGLSKGGLPAVGALGVPILSLVMSPVAAAGLLLPVYVLSDMLGLLAYRRGFDRQVLRILLPAATAGIGLGWATASLVPEWVVSVLVGMIGLTYALRLITRRQQIYAPTEPSLAKGNFWGMLTGFTSFVSHSGAAPYQIFVLPLGLPKAVFAATSTVAFAYINLVKLVPYWALGQLSGANLRMAFVLCLPAALAVWAGVRLTRAIPETLFFRLVAWALAVVSLQLIWAALAA